MDALETVHYLSIPPILIVMTELALQARGTFEVVLTPQGTDGTPEETALGRLAIAKTFSGDIVGTSTGEMLSAITSVKGSAAYVAIERVRGSIGGRVGTFVLHHRGIMDRGAQQLLISVVPDSGSGDLAELTGEMSLVVANGVHSYELNYCLPDA